MLNRLPSGTGSFRELAEDIGLKPSDNKRIARALDVSERTVRRWWTSEAPKTACLALWWLSREGHSVWDCEMHERTRMAHQTNEALWAEVRRLRRLEHRTGDLRPVGQAYGPPANESGTGQPGFSLDGMSRA